MYYEDCFIPYPVIETERLILRKVRFRDVPELFGILSEPAVSRFSPWSPHQTVGDTADFVRWQKREYRHHRLTSFVVTDKENGSVIGTCSFVKLSENGKIAEIGYSLSPKEWGKGYGSEVAWALTGFAFDVLHAQRVCAEVIPENERSARLLKNLHFVCEGRAKKGFSYGGYTADIDVYAMTDDRYFAVKSSSGAGTPLKLIK